MKKVSLIAIIFFASFVAVHAQTESSNQTNSKESVQTPKTKTSILNRISIGGNIGGGFTNNYTYLNIQPRISYRVANWFIPGISLMYQYSQERAGTFRYNYNAWGAGAFAEIYPIKYVYGHIEYQHVWYKRTTKPAQTGSPSWGSDDYFILGVGVNIPVGNKTYLFASILFDVLQPVGGIYENPIYNVGFRVNL